MKRHSAIALASSAVVLIGVAAVPAFAGTGQTQNAYGCTGYWSDTASWGNCKNVSKTITVRLQTACKLQSDYSGPWKSISKGSSVAPFDAYDCRFAVQGVTLGFN